MNEIDEKKYEDFAHSFFDMMMHAVKSYNELSKKYDKLEQELESLRKEVLN